MRTLIWVIIEVLLGIVYWIVDPEPLRAAGPYVLFLLAVLITHQIATQKDVGHGLERIASRLTEREVKLMYVFAGVLGFALFFYYWHGAAKLTKLRRAEPIPAKAEPVPTAGQIAEEVVKRLPATSPPQATRSPAKPVAPYFGNLHERSTALAREMLAFVDFRRRERDKLLRDDSIKGEDRADMLRTKAFAANLQFQRDYLDRAMAIQRDLAAFSISNDEVDRILRYEQREKDRQSSSPMRVLFSWDDRGTERLARLIEVMADQTRTIPRLPGEELKYTIRPLESQEAPYSIEAIAKASRMADKGYVVVEFDQDGVLQFGANFANAIDPPEPALIANKEVADLFRHVGPAGGVYAIKIGRTPLTPEVPIYIRILSRKPIRITRIRLFDE